MYSMEEYIPISFLVPEHRFNSVYSVLTGEKPA
jgi:hypothetical protein